MNSCAPPKDTTCSGSNDSVLHGVGPTRVLIMLKWPDSGQTWDILDRDSARIEIRCPPLLTHSEHGGNTVRLAVGSTFQGNSALPNKGECNDWMVIRTDTPDSNLPLPGTRITRHMPMSCQGCSAPMSVRTLQLRVELTISGMLESRSVWPIVLS